MKNRSLQRLTIAFKSGVILLLLFCIFIPQSVSTAQLPVHQAIKYAQEHWDWKKYDDPNNLAEKYEWQDNFQCAEFVARSLIAVHSIGDLQPSSTQSQLGSVKYNQKTYNLNAVTGLYRFIIDTGIGRDMGPDITNATLGSVVIYGNFNHVTIVTVKEVASDPKISGHNQAMLDYPIDQFYYNDKNQMAITHILQINYTKIAGDDWSSVSVPQGKPVSMLAPAPYSGALVSSGLTLKWQATNGAKGYDISVYNVWGQLVWGMSIMNSTVNLPLATLPYGIYNYSIQPISDIASFMIFYDTFNYEPEWCQYRPRSPECGSASGRGASNTGSSIVLGMSIIAQPEISTVRPAQRIDTFVMIQNTGQLKWTKGSVSLVHSLGPDFGVQSIQFPEIPSGAIVKVPITISAPDHIGWFDSIWQLKYENQAFGDDIHFTIVATPDGESLGLQYIVNALLDNIQQELSQQIDKLLISLVQIIEQYTLNAFKKILNSIFANCGITPIALIWISRVTWWQRVRRE